MWPTITVSESVSIPVYTLVLSLVSCACILWIDRRSNSPLTLPLTALIFITGFIGARAFHILYEEPSYYLANPAQVFAIWRGGFVWYGGLLTAFFSTFVWCHLKGQSFLKWADFFAPVIAMGYGFGRLACYFNGCCYGKYCETSWGFTRHPTQLYMFAYEVAIALWLLKIEKKPRAVGQLFFIWLGLHGLGRFLVEFFRDDPRGPTLGPVSVSAFMSFIFMGVAIVRIYFLPPEEK